MKCANCGKELKRGMEIEYSNDLCEYYCEPDCATTRYYDAMRSTPISYGDMIKQIKELEK